MRYGWSKERLETTCYLKRIINFLVILTFTLVSDIKIDDPESKDLYCIISSDSTQKARTHTISSGDKMPGFFQEYEL